MGWLEMFIKKIKEAIELYNKFRRPEAVAELLFVNNNEVGIKFSGSFVDTCGVDNWVEDFIYVMKEVGIEGILERYIEPDDPTEAYRIGVFKILN